MKRLSAGAYLALVQDDARKLFKDHVIRSRDNRSWLCFKPYSLEKGGGWDSAFWFEAIVLAGGELYVHGDIDGVHFAHYGRHENPEQVLRWMGGTSDLGHYVMQKASIGMCLPNAARCVLEIVDERVWLDEALDYIEQNYMDGKKLVVDEEDVDVELADLVLPEWLADMVGDVLAGVDVREAIMVHSCGEAHEVGAFEWGEVPSHRVIFAHEALRKLVSLLDAERAAADSFAVAVDQFAAGKTLEEVFAAEAKEKP